MLYCATKLPSRDLNPGLRNPEAWFYHYTSNMRYELALDSWIAILLISLVSLDSWRAIRVNSSARIKRDHRWRLPKHALDRLI